MSQDEELRKVFFDIGCLIDQTRGQEGRDYRDAQRDFVDAVKPIFDAHHGDLDTNAVHGTCGEIFEGKLPEQEIETVQDALAKLELSVPIRMGLE